MLGALKHVGYKVLESLIEKILQKKKACPSKLLEAFSEVDPLPL